MALGAVSAAGAGGLAAALVADHLYDDGSHSQQKDTAYDPRCHALCTYLYIHLKMGVRITVLANQHVDERRQEYDGNCRAKGEPGAREEDAKLVHDQ